MKKVLVAASLVLMLTGCKSVIDPVDESIDVFHPVETGSSRVFKVYNNGRITEDMIVKALVQSMYDNSSVEPASRKLLGDERKMHYIIGIGIIPESNSIDVVYAANPISRYSNLREVVSVNQRKAKFGLNINQSGKYYHVTLECPKSVHEYNQNRAENRDFAEHKNIANIYSINNVEADLKQVCSNADITLERTKWIKGEFESKLSEEEVLGNLHRIIQPEYHGSKLVPTGRNHFDYDINGKKSSLLVNVYPYRGGSKVTYTFEYQYQFKSDGSSTYSSETANKVKADIVRIAND